MDRFDFFEELQRGPDFDHAVICTYNLDLQFLEQYALERFRAFQSCETITVVTTTMIINVLKVFDIVFVMTNGLNGTEVIATRMFKFIVTNQGRSMAIAVLLIVLTVPILIYNVRRFREQERMR